ncbi:MAG: TRAP transporter TatT component family protein [Desulfarculaceae bacterium]|nr:TRAP transporter TatT component family protein [Desulfarculaceae bacterium]MCF8070793.1 TRAP transporter TatT component family protein [Desulfarculaceae bacterium]MCF8102230.1 TRAP transporter TatT component family protein [Desulfarculaceae bacterium]MCF8116971.1 TRAP transporter TatT component family protein [Desulfarculaceae bacterium]
MRCPRRLASLALALLMLGGLAGPAPAMTNAQLSARADALYEERGDLAKAAMGVEMYRRMVASEPGDLAASLRLCELLVWLGAQSPDEQAEEYFREVIVVAQQARRAHPKEPGPLFYLGMGQGLLADVCSFPEALVLVKQARKNMDKLAASDPAYCHGGPDRVLGRIYTKMPAFIGGDNDLAEQHYKRAIQYGPRYWLNQLYLAELYYQEGENDKARKLLEEVASGRPLPTLMPECRIWQRMARQALADGQPPH